jgi:putative ABC transport system permease protein
MQAEPFRAVPVKLRSGHRSRRLALMGIEPAARLHRLVDRDLNKIHLPAGGVVMSAKLGELLDVGIGDTLTVEVLEGARPVKAAVVAGMVNDFSGLSAYMDVRSLNAMMDEQPTVSGAFARIEPGREETVYATLKRLPFVAGVTIKRAAWKSFQDTIAENMLRMRAFNIVFAAIIACGVVYNSARVSLSERGRELATLRVIGFTRGEISSILLGELGVLTLIAIPTGLLIGYWLAAWIIAGLDTDMYRIPLVVTGGTYAFASIVTVIAALVSGLIVRRRIDRLDLIAVLKTRE